MVKVCILASSSAGNSTFISTGNTRLLIDAGLSRRETLRRLAAIGEAPERLHGILVTHEHSDHICGLATLARGLKVPVFLTQGTAPMIDWGTHQPCLELFAAGTRFCVGDVEVCSFTVPHDAADPVGFCFHAEGIRIGIATDLGYLPDSLSVHLRQTHLLVLESNHDLEMLKVGPYPWSLKQRVMGRRGHLSNEHACQFIAEGLDAATHTLVLGHLSEQNNHPEIARVAAARALERRGLSTRLVVAEPRQQSEVFVF